MAQNASAHAITYARNCLRPFYRARKHRPYWKQLQSIRQDTGIADFPSICAVVEGNAAYPFSGLGNTFPNSELEVPNANLRLLSALPLGRELALQISRLNHHSGRVAAALQSLARINGALAERQFTLALSIIDEHRRLYGLSFIVVKKYLLAALEENGFPGLSAAYKKLTETFDRTGWAILCRYIFDFVDPTSTPERAAPMWQAAADLIMEKGDWYARIIRDDVLGFSSSEDELAVTLLRVSSLSLLDLAVLLWRKRTIHPDSSELKVAFRSLDTSIRSVLEANFSSLSIHVPEQYRPPGSPLGDDEIYRMSFLFDDIGAVALWRSDLPLFSNLHRLAPVTIPVGSAALDAVSAAIAENPGTMNQELPKLIQWEKSFLDGTETIDRHPFLDAVVAAHAVRKIVGADNQDPNTLLELIAKIDDVVLYLSVDDLARIYNSKMAATSPLLVFVARELIYRKVRGQDNELERRLAFMALFQQNYAKPIVSEIRTIANFSRATALLLAMTCTRSFLERLYLLMRDVKDVLQARIAICEWLLSLEGEQDEDVVEERKALKRELENLGERSDLDSTRVHVDEEALHEWFAVTQLSSANRYVQTVIAEGPRQKIDSMLAYYGGKSKGAVEGTDEAISIETRVGSQFLLLGIAEDTLRAFARDKTFGLDAYLSRRIRHGTLSGHVTTPITRILKRALEAKDSHQMLHSFEELPGVDHFANEFARVLASELDHMRKDVIQIKSELHPNGLIGADWRYAANIAHLDAMIARVHSRVLHSGSSDIFPDIYAFCWDCLEVDLAQLRLFVTRQLHPRLQTALKNLFDPLSASERELLFPYAREIDLTLRARLLEVSGWFIRPVFRRDRYSLKGLISSTFSLVRELDDKYAFVERVEIEEDIELNRLGFEVFGDALFVLIGNAAKHAMQDGTVTVSATRPDGQASRVCLDVVSEIASEDDMETVGARIKKAVRVAEEQLIATAAVEEGFSGLRKLVGILARVKLSNEADFFVITNGPARTFAFRVILPAEINPARGIQ